MSTNNSLEPGMFLQECAECFTDSYDMSWFGSIIPGKCPAVVPERRVYNLADKASDYIEGILPAWRNSSGDVEIPVGALIKFGPYCYTVEDYGRKTDCSSCDIGFHCNCVGIVCADRKDKKSVFFLREIIITRALRSTVLILNNILNWTVKLRPKYNRYEFYPNTGDCTISFDVLFSSSQYGRRQTFFWDESSDRYWTRLSGQSMSVEDIVINGKSTFKDIATQFVKSIDWEKFKARKGLHALEKLEVES